jgi:DNA polymerase III alpha subunit
MAPLIQTMEHWNNGTMQLLYMYETLHSHTTTSDGILSYTELLDLFKHNSISTVAFTDHDALINADTFL